MVNFTILFLRAYDRVSEMCGTVKKLIDYYTSSTPSKWVFLTSSTTPIPLGTFHNSRYNLPSNIEYLFDTYRQTLLLSDGAHSTQMLPFLSGTLTVGDRTFSMDEFIDTAQFEITTSKIPIPLMILRCWSIVNGVWFCDEHQPIFDFIDMEGNEHSFEIFSTDLDYKLWDRLLLGNVESDDDSDNEAESEAETDADAEAETDAETDADAETPSESTDISPAIPTESTDVPPAIPTESTDVPPTIPTESTDISPAIPSESTDVPPAIPSESAIPVEESSVSTLPPSQPDSEAEVDTPPVLPTMTDVPVLSS